MAKVTKKIIKVPVHVTVKKWSDELMKKIGAVNLFIIVENKAGTGLTLSQWKADTKSQIKLAKLLMQDAAHILGSHVLVEQQIDGKVAKKVSKKRK